MTEVLERPTVAKKEARALMPERMGLAEHRRQDWVVNAEEGTKPSDVLAPAYWAHCADQFQQFDRIEVREETGAWIAELAVTQSGRNWAQVHQLQLYELSERAAEIKGAKLHRVEWKGPQRKHVVIRNADDQVVQDGFGQKRDAEQWVENHERVTSA